MIEIIAAWGIGKISAYVGGSIIAFILAWILKKIPNEKIKKFVGSIMYGAGVSITLGLSKWSITARYWNKIIEPFLVDLIDNVVGHGVKEFIRGLRSDN